MSFGKKLVLAALVHVAIFLLYLYVPGAERARGPVLLLLAAAFVFVVIQFVRQMRASRG